MPIKIGISRCLLGEKVRYDGEHKRNSFLTDIMGKHVEYVPVCPEVECGMSVPRETLQLIGDAAHPRLMTTHTQKDYTEQMIQWACKRVAELEKETLRGFIFKKNSPSCGIAQVNLYTETGEVVKKGIGIFAKIFMEHFPLLPVADEELIIDNWELIIDNQ